MKMKPLSVLVLLLAYTSLSQTNEFRFGNRTFKAQWITCSPNESGESPSNHIQMVTNYFAEIFRETGNVEVFPPVPEALKSESRFLKDGRLSGWIILCTFNPKNKFGGPTGRKLYCVFVSGKNICPFRVQKNDDVLTLWTIEKDGDLVRDDWGTDLQSGMPMPEHLITTMYWNGVFNGK